MHSRTPLVLCLLLASLSAWAAPPEVEARLRVLLPVTVNEYHGDEGRGLRLSFQQLPPDPALARFSREAARVVVVALEAEFEAARLMSKRPLPPSLPRRGLTGTLVVPSTRSGPLEMERRIRQQYEALYGSSSYPLPTSLESARWLQALKLSPRYMPEGVREAAVDMFSSPTVLLSVGMSMMLYAMAWAAPEPVLSKGFAAAVTLGLLMTYTAAELYAVGVACLNLYREAEAARTPEQLEAAAERFGKAIGGVGLRVMVTVAGAKLTRSLPEVPKGGLWAQLSPPRLAFAGGRVRGGFRVGSGARAQVSVADGTVVLMGVSSATVAYAVASAVASARTTGGCAGAKGHGNEGHHIATNKNDKSDVFGGPWTPRFRELFEKAGMSLDDPANIIYLIGHKGPHPEVYHQEIFDRLSQAVATCRSRAECKRMLIDALDEIAGDICKPGSRLGKLLIKMP